MAGLFRREAIEHQTDRLTGDVLVVLPLSTKVLTVFLAILVLVIILFLTFGTYARTETARGYVEPESGVSQVFTAEPGRIVQVHINEDSVVEMGEILVTISATHYLEGGASTQNILLTDMDGLIREIDDLMILKEQDNSNEIKRLHTQLKNYHTEKARLTKQFDLSWQRIDLVKEQLLNAEALIQDEHISELELQRVKDDLYAAQWESERLAQLIVQTDSKVQEAELILEQLPLKLQLGHSALQTRKAELILRRTELQVRGTYLLTAPVSGRISGLYVKSGQHIDANALLLSVLPEGSKLQAILYVPTRAIGFVEKDQDVRLFYDAFPHQRFGVHLGSVLNVSSTVLMGPELRVPTTISEPVYKVTVALENQSVKAFGSEYPLQSGMQLGAEIVLETRSIMEWILEPLYAVRGHL